MPKGSFDYEDEMTARAVCKAIGKGAKVGVRGNRVQVLLPNMGRSVDAGTWAKAKDMVVDYYIGHTGIGKMGQ